ncbi:DUF2326 domain-containing protein [Maridesulfovibrio ferrireducens]|uniref:DUF2326 domain-containing protein n=1 Tax=Maridesulfovibrio ferrireducens TaxID=246191 RepID=UPI001A2889A4|nr:DUF2326 domain-containing protein [Maridesulfovibrio ferrireducens]MBI9112750.1 DUF2326 domain-containing protein [Maridesulfovibrio ferrireducens]
MKLSKLYSNEPLIFKEIFFNQGLNVILGEIRLAKNQNKDVHNLGKSLAGKLIDYCLLKKKNKHFFLFKYYDRFEHFGFLLEIELLDGSYLTIRRDVKNSSKISMKRHTKKFMDFSELDDDQWDHLNLPFDKSKQLLDGILNLQSLSTWHYRMILGYLLRTQEDYNDIFQLRKFQSKHSDWKPFIASIMGFDGKEIEQHYVSESKLENEEKNKKDLLKEIGGKPADMSKISGLLLLKGNELQDKQKSLESFDFTEEDKDQTSKLVNGIESRLVSLNSERYIKSANWRKVVDSLKEGQITFSPDDASALFEEAGIFFKGQIKNNFKQLIEFNKAITEERLTYLQEEKEELETELTSINQTISQLNKERSQALQFLKDTDVFNKFKKTNKEITLLAADVEILKRQKKTAEEISAIDKKISNIHDELKNLRTNIEADVKYQDEDKNSLFSKIRIYYNEIIETVISRKALLTTPVNKYGHIEFNVAILDQAGKETGAGDGNTYKKLLSIAFDMSILRAYSTQKFPRFVFHDGAFESLDDRKKLLLTKTIREYANFGIQQIITLIDSELPTMEDGNKFSFEDDEIVLLLHDEDNSGQLFMMDPW